MAVWKELGCAGLAVCVEEQLAQAAKNDWVAQVLSLHVHLKVGILIKLMTMHMFKSQSTSGNSWPNLRLLRPVLVQHAEVFEGHGQT